MRHHRSIVICVLLLNGLVAAAEPLYVDDKLVLNVYAEPDQGGGRVATIETGDVVEEIERADKFVHVRLADGREGWVGANYLTAQPPAIVRLKELQSAQPATASAGADDAQARRLTGDVARLTKQNASLTTEVTDLKKKLAAKPAENSAPPAVVQPVSEPAPEPEAPIEEPPPAVASPSYWWAWLLAVLASGGIGFFAGYQTLGSRVRARFGGVKVY